jgi:hypothetical protein
MKKTKLHEALDLIVPTEFKPDALIIALLPLEKRIHVIYALLAILLSVLNLMDALIFDGVWIRWVIIWGLWYLLGVYIRWRFDRHHKQMKRITEFCNSYTGINFKAHHLLEITNKVYLQSVAENIIAEND